MCSTKSLDLVRSLGADEVVDYTREDFTKNGGTYDVIFDAVGKHSFRRCRRSLKPSGIFIETDLGFMWHAPALALLTKWIGDKRAKIGIARYRKEDVLLLKELIEAGKHRAVIDRRYLLDEVIEANEICRDGTEDRQRRPDGRACDRCLGVAGCLGATGRGIVERVHGHKKGGERPAPLQGGLS